MYQILAFNECVCVPIKRCPPFEALRVCFYIFRAKKLLFWYLSHVSLGSRIADLPREIGFVDGRCRGLRQTSSSSASRVSRKLRHVLQQAAAAPQAYGGQSARGGFGGFLIYTSVGQNWTWWDSSSVYVMCVSSEKIFDFTKLWRILLVGWVSLSLWQMGGLPAVSGLLPRWTWPAKVYSPEDLFSFKNRFQNNMHCFLFQQKYVDANRFVLRSQMEYCYENHLERKSFPNTAKLMTCNITGHMTCFVKLLAQQIFIVKLTHL